MQRPCLTCTQLTNTGPRCTTCQAKIEYRGWTQTAARTALARTLPTPCAYCNTTITHADTWVAAHVVDGKRAHGYVAAHPLCNEQAKTNDH